MTPTAILAIVGAVLVVGGLGVRLWRSGTEATPAGPSPVDPSNAGKLTRPEVWAHVQALAEHFQAAGDKDAVTCVLGVLASLLPGSMNDAE